MRALLLTLLLGVLSVVGIGCSDDAKPETEPLKQDGVCTEGGRTYKSGERWTCSDGCNSCGCDKGVISSTTMACVDADPPFMFDTNVPSETSTPTDTSVADATDGG
jgi:hypothetical protein